MGRLVSGTGCRRAPLNTSKRASPQGKKSGSFIRKLGLTPKEANWYYQRLALSTASRNLYHSLQLLPWKKTQLVSQGWLPYSPEGLVLKKKKEQATKARPGILGLKSLRLRVDVVLRLLLPTVPFKCLARAQTVALLKSEQLLVWPPESLDSLALLLYCNPLFLGAKLFDISAFIQQGAAPGGRTLYYIFSLPGFSSWLVVFLPIGVAPGSASCVVSLESMFKSAA